MNPSDSSFKPAFDDQEILQLRTKVPELTSEYYRNLLLLVFVLWQW